MIQTDNKKIHVALIVFAGLLAYLNTLSVPFFLDDYTSLVHVPLIKDFSYFTDPASAKGYKGYGGFISRYFGYLTFAVNYRLGGLNVVGYHLVNIGIHLLSALLVYRLVLLSFLTPVFSRGCGSAAGRRAGSFTALLAALLFVLHPLQTQAVTYLVQRFASLAAMLYLLCLTSYIRARLAQVEFGPRAGLAAFWYLCALAAALLAFKTKEISYTLPFMVLLYEMFFFEHRLTRRALRFGMAALALAGCAAGAFLVFSGASVTAIVARLDQASRLQTSMSRLDYLATQCRVLVTYLRLLVFPVGQHLDYDYPVSEGFLNPPVLFSIALLGSLFACALYFLWRSRGDEAAPDGQRPLYRLMAFGVFWFFITLAIESSVIPIVDVIFEHRMYLPSVGLLMALAAVVSLLGTTGLSASGWPGRPLLIGVVTVLLVLGGATVARNQLWRDEVSFWRDNAGKTPLKARVFLNLGRSQERIGDLAGAENAYRTANTLDPGLTDPLINLGLLYTQAGRLDEALPKFQAALAIDPGQAEAHNNIGKIYGMRMQLDEALKEFLQAAKLKPNLAEPYNNIGYLHALRNNHSEALKAYEQSLARDPDYVQAYLNRGMTLLATGRSGEARSDFRRALELDPSCVEAAEQLQRAGR